MSICYLGSFEEYVAKRQFKPQYYEYTNDKEELNLVVDNVILHTLYHEIGYALVDMRSLPVAGKEKDAVDELSTLILLESYEGRDATGEFNGRIAHNNDFQA